MKITFFSTIAEMMMWIFYQRELLKVYLGFGSEKKYLSTFINSVKIKKNKVTVKENMGKLKRKLSWQ